MKKLIFFISATAFFLSQLTLNAQVSNSNRSVTYDILYDDPYDINRLFVHIQPVYAELFMTNVNIGFGIEGEYYLKDQFNFNMHYRKAYGPQFDFMRDVAEKNSDALNSPKKFHFAEFSATYHIIDREKATTSKFVLYSDRYRELNRWETMVPETIKAPATMRQIYGVRLGGINYQSAIDVNSIIKNQDEFSLDTLNGLSVYSNLSSFGIFVGGTMHLIKNIALEFDQTYEQVSNDLIFNVYADILFSPFMEVDDIYYRLSPIDEERMVTSDIIKLNSFGGRAGLKGKFNRELSFGYNIEIGYRPGIRGDNIYFLGKVSFPLIGSKLEKEVEAFQN